MPAFRIGDRVAHSYPSCAEFPFGCVIETWGCYGYRIKWDSSPFKRSLEWEWDLRLVIPSGTIGSSFDASGWKPKYNMTALCQRLMEERDNARK